MAGEKITQSEELDQETTFLLDDDIEPVSIKTFKISCCRSYMTPKGRCYTCPEEGSTEEDM